MSSGYISGFLAFFKNCFEKFTDNGVFTEQGQELEKILERAKDKKEDVTEELAARFAAAKSNS